MWFPGFFLTFRLLQFKCIYDKNYRPLSCFKWYNLTNQWLLNTFLPTLDLHLFRSLTQDILEFYGVLKWNLFKFLSKFKPKQPVLAAGRREFWCLSSFSGFMDPVFFLSQQEVYFKKHKFNTIPNVQLRNVDRCLQQLDAVSRSSAASLTFFPFLCFPVWGKTPTKWGSRSCWGECRCRTSALAVGSF